MRESKSRGHSAEVLAALAELQKSALEIHPQITQIDLGKSVDYFFYRSTFISSVPVPP